MTAFESILWTQGCWFNLLQPELTLFFSQNLMDNFIPVMPVASHIPINLLNTWTAGLFMSASSLWADFLIIYLCYICNLTLTSCWCSYPSNMVYCLLSKRVICVCTHPRVQCTPHTFTGLVSLRSFMTFGSHLNVCTLNLPLIHVCVHVGPFCC